MSNSTSRNRSLQLEEVTRLIASDKAAKKAAETDKKAATAMAWPGAYNMRLLAEAVSNRREFVIFEPYKRFKIRYDSIHKAVFVKPDGKDMLVPCGWFPYDKLKEYMESEDGTNND